MKNSLRSLSFIVMVFLILLITGCSLIDKNNKEDTSEVNTDYNTNETNTTTDTDEETKLINKSKKLYTKDIASEYVINAKTLDTYKYKNDQAVSYVNISEFIKFMDGGIIDLNITKSDVMTISYTFDVPSEYQQIYGETYSYEMTIDAENEVISYNDFDMVSSINAPMLTQYKTELVVSDIDLIEDDPSVEIDLKLYNLDIVLFEDGYYIPLYLANLFFTGSYINVYEMSNNIYVIDDFSDFNMLFNAFRNDRTKKVSDISSHTKNYLALYFDYFYGLKDYKNIETYRTVLDDYDFEKNTFKSLHKELESFIKSQNDLHTALISTGYLDKFFRPSSTQSNKLSNYVTAYTNNQCILRKSELDYKNYGDTFVIELNQFTLDTKDLLKPAMEEAKKYDDIVIDVSCNPGGNLIGVVELLSYMTDEKIPVSYINPATGGKFIEYYETTNNVFLDKNFYVYTSPATFSAANLFTSIVKDQELAIIFGEKTSGGASAITYTVLPDGALIVNSSNLTLINKNDEVIEDGIDVDINYNNQFDWYDLIGDLNNMLPSS
ncbi:peptidase S41 [Mycoplasmatota bacterium]|nr:peptidase S41 [Mycoplasmatota bacterium]